DGIRDFHVTGVQTCALPICACDGNGKVRLSGGEDRFCSGDRDGDTPSQPRRKTFVRIGDTGLRIHRRRSTELRPGKPYFSRRERSEERRVGKECMPKRTREQ